MRSHRVAVCLGAVVTALALARPLPSAAPRAGAAAPAQEASGRVLVMPFAFEGRSAQAYWLREAAAILLTGELERRGIDAVTRGERVAAFARLQLPAWPPVSRAMAIKVAQLVGADRLVLGTLAIGDESLDARSRTIRLDSGQAGPEHSAGGSFAELFTIFERLAGPLAGGMTAAPAAPAPDASRPPLVAFESFVKGLVAENPTTVTEFLERAVTIHPEYDEARLALWQAYADQGAHDHAWSVVEPVEADSPWARRARFAGALSKIELRRYDEAFADLQGLTGTGYAAAVYNNLGVIQLRRPAQQQYGTPESFFNRAVQSDPDSSDFLFNLGYAYWLERKLDAAIHWLREAVRRNPADGNAHRVLASALELTGASVEAARERELAERLGPGGGGPPETGASAATRPGLQGLERLSRDLEPSRAEQLDRVIVSAAEQEQRELAGFHLERGRTLLADGRDHEALAELRRTVFLAPYHAEAHLLIGRAHFGAGRVADAIEALIISLWGSETVAGHVALGEAYAQAGEPERARAHAERALALDPRSAEAKALVERLGPGAR